MTHTLIRGGRLTDGPADILIREDTITEVGKPQAPLGVKEIDASGKLLHPGLVNAHMHGHGNLAKGMGDRWTLELLLTAAPWITGHRSLEDKYLATLIGAAEMLMKGCTACYDLTVELTAEDYQATLIRSAVNAGVVLPPQALRLLDTGSANPLGSAIQKTGLAFESRKAPLDVVIVDSSLKSPTAN